jgi:hypothetical protein
MRSTLLPAPTSGEGHFSRAHEAWKSSLGVAHGKIKDEHHGSGLSFRDPDNIALELFAPPA